jgi:hypothetical protein
MDVASIWVRLPGLPAEFWIKESLSDLGNAMGTFLDADMSFLTTGELTVARILVSFDIRGGLAEELELVLEDKHYFQKLDYEGIPFQDKHYFQKLDYEGIASPSDLAVVITMAIFPTNVICPFIPWPYFQPMSSALSWPERRSSNAD